MKQLAGSVNDLMGGNEGEGKGNDANKNQNTSNQNNSSQGTQGGAPQSNPKEQKNR
jgi:hypothetical protein